MDQEIIEQLKARIPQMECKAGCFDCCTAFFWIEDRESEPENPAAYQTLSCPYLVAGSCSIYEHRPIICRLFGASEDPSFHCPHGRRAVHPISIDETKEILDRWLSSYDGQGTDEEPVA